MDYRLSHGWSQTLDACIEICPQWRYNYLYVEATAATHRKHRELLKNVLYLCDLLLKNWKFKAITNSQCQLATPLLDQ